MTEAGSEPVASVEEVFDEYVESAYDHLVDFVCEREEEIREEARDTFSTRNGSEEEFVTAALVLAGAALNNLVRALYAKDQDK